MKIGVVSDTHSLALPQQMWDDFKAVDLIIHAGDICTLEDLKLFMKVRDVKAVWGNMDDVDVKKLLPEELLFEVGKCRIGIYHGEGPGAQVINVVRKRFTGKNVNVVVFGHSHNPMNEVIDNVLYFNPGSPNDTVRAPYRSYGILNVENGKISGKIIKVKA